MAILSHILLIQSAGLHWGQFDLLLLLDLSKDVTLSSRLIVQQQRSGWTRRAAQSSPMPVTFSRFFISFYIFFKSLFLTQKDLECVVNVGVPVLIHKRIVITKNQELCPLFSHKLIPPLNFFGLSHSRRAAVRPGGGVSGEDRRRLLRHQQIPAGRSQPRLPAAGASAGHEEIPAAGPRRLHQTPHGPAEVSRTPLHAIRVFCFNDTIR